MTENAAKPPADSTPPQPPPPSTPPPESGNPPPQPPPPDQGSAPPGTTPPPESGTPPPDTRTPAEKRIQELVAHTKRLETVVDASREYAEFWRKRAEQGAAVPADVKAAQAHAEQAKPAPKLSDFKGNTEKWAAALQDWNSAEIQRGIKAGISEAAKAAQAAAQQTSARTTYKQRVDAFKQAHPDYENVIRTPGLQVTDEMRDAILASEAGPAIAYHLGENVALSREIASLPPQLQLMRMGALEATIAAKASSAPPPPATPPASPPPPATPPPPGTPLQGGQPPSINLKTASLDDYLRHRLGVRPPRP